MYNRYGYKQRWYRRTVALQAGDFAFVMALIFLAGCLAGVAIGINYYA